MSIFHLWNAWVLYFYFRWLLYGIKLFLLDLGDKFFHVEAPHALSEHSGLTKFLLDAIPVLQIFILYFLFFKAPPSCTQFMYVYISRTLIWEKKFVEYALPIILSDCSLINNLGIWVPTIKSVGLSAAQFLIILRQPTSYN